MKKPFASVRIFVSRPVGMAALFIVTFYVMAFLVYYFYSPGPQERRQAQIQQTNP